MGCDIHTIGQVRKNGQWTTVATNIANENRNYDDFAILANVRNGYGFAGSDTGEGWTPISEPKGLPDDLELEDDTPNRYGYVEAYVKVPEYKYYGDEIRDTKWLGDHSYSYHTLEEIEEYVENRMPKKYTTHGVVDKETFLALESGELESPRSWCGGVGGARVKQVSLEEARNGADFTHVRTSWETDAIDCTNIREYVEELRGLAKKHGVDACDVRMVFGFDS